MKSRIDFWNIWNLGSTAEILINLGLTTEIYMLNLGSTAEIYEIKDWKHEILLNLGSRAEI